MISAKSAKPKANLLDWETLVHKQARDCQSKEMHKKSTASTNWVWDRGEVKTQKNDSSKKGKKK